MRKPHHGEPKRQGGISLPPALWAKIEETARRAGVPKNRVMEKVLLREFGMGSDLRKTEEIDPFAEVRVVEDLGDDD